MSQSSPEKPSDDPQVARLALAIETMNDHRMIRMYNSTWRLLLFQFARGLAFGFGTVVGATVLVSAAVLFLSQFEFIPVLGEWITRLIEEINTPRGPQ